MRIARVLATMLFGLFCAGALALDDTPTYAPHPQVKAEDGRAAIRPAGAGAAIVPAKRDSRPAAVPRPAVALPAQVPVVSTPRPAPAPSAGVIEKPIWKLQ